MAEIELTTDSLSLKELGDLIEETNAILDDHKGESTRKQVELSEPRGAAVQGLYLGK